MAAQFKNVVTQIDTTGSGQLLLRCPAGKVILIKNIKLYYVVILPKWKTTKMLILVGVS